MTYLSYRHRNGAVKDHVGGPEAGTLDAPLVEASPARSGPLSGRTVLVTGAAGGIGGATAEAMHLAGATVYGIDRDAQRVAQLAEQAGWTPRWLDLGAPQWRDELGRFPFLGDVDVLVNIAGALRPSLLHEADPEDLDEALTVMLGAAMHLARAVLPGMYERGHGRVLGVSSVFGRQAGDGKGGYCTAKAGMHGLYKQIAIEGAPRGVAANLVCPGHVDTELLHRQAIDEGKLNGTDPERQRDKLRRDMPAGRFVKASEVAKVLVWLAAEAPVMLTGAEIPIDGAWGAGTYSGFSKA